MKNKPLLLITFLLIAICTYVFVISPLFSESNKNIKNEAAAAIISSNDLVSKYQNNEKTANKLYAGKIIEVTGKIKEITFLNKRNTIILEGNSTQYGVICDIHPEQVEKVKILKKNQKIKVKGICKGFLKDVIILNCTIDLLDNE